MIGHIVFQQYIKIEIGSKIITLHIFQKTKCPIHPMSKKNHKRNGKGNLKYVRCQHYDVSGIVLG